MKLSFFLCYVADFLCTIVHYRAWTESTQHKFEDTWQEQRPVEMVLGKGVCLADFNLVSIFRRCLCNEF